MKAIDVPLASTPLKFKIIGKRKGRKKFFIVTHSGILRAER